MSPTGSGRLLSSAFLYSSTAESSPRSHSARIAWSSPLVTADFRLIQARCSAPAALLVVAGSGSPMLWRWLCSCAANWERCCEYSLKSDFSCGSFTPSAACLNPSCPSLSVSITLLVVETTCFWSFIQIQSRPATDARVSILLILRHSVVDQRMRDNAAGRLVDLRLIRYHLDPIVLLVWSVLRRNYLRAA